LYIVAVLEIIKYGHLRRIGLLRHSTAPDDAPVPPPGLRR
jgi:hypothetical protein